MLAASMARTLSAPWSSASTRPRRSTGQDQATAPGGGLGDQPEGPAGIGKTQLLTEARERAGRSMTVLGARASELERDFPYGVVRQLFEGLLADPARYERALSGAAEPAAAVFGAVGSGDDGDPGGASFAALHGLLWLSVNLSEERPLLLCIDDLQWCDRPSLRLSRTSRAGSRGCRS
jgi:hypothetical protein